MVLYKSFSAFSRHASLAKNIFVASTNVQPSFFASNVVPRQPAVSQTQLLNGGLINSFGGQSAGSKTAHGGAAAQVQGNLVSHVAPLTATDDEEDLLHSMKRHHSRRLSSPYPVSPDRLLTFPPVPNMHVRAYSTETAVASNVQHPDENIIKHDDSKVAEQQDVEDDSRSLSTLREEDRSSLSSVRSDSHLNLQSSSDLSQQDNESIATAVTSPETQIVSNTTKPLVTSWVEEEELDSDKDEPLSFTVNRPKKKQVGNSSGAEPSPSIIRNQQVNTEIFQSFTAGNFSHVISLYRKMRNNKEVPDRLAYNCVLRSIASIITHDLELQVSDLLRIFSEMLKYHVGPDTTTYGVIIQALCKKFQFCHDRLEAMEPLLSYGILHENTIRKLQETENESQLTLSSALDTFFASVGSGSSHRYPVEVYNELLLACSVSSNHAASGKEILQIMKEAQVEPNATSFAAVIRANAVAGSLSDSIREFEEFKQSGTQLLEENVFNVYNALLEAYVMNGEPENAIKFYEKVIDVSAASDYGFVIKIYESLIRHFAKYNEYQTAWAWIMNSEERVNLARVPVATVDKVLLSAARNEDYKLSLEIFHYLSSYPGFNKKFWASRGRLLVLAEKNDDIATFMSLLEEGKNRRVCWDPNALTQITRFLIKRGEITTAIQVADMTLHASTYQEYFNDTGDWMSYMEALDILFKDLSEVNCLEDFQTVLLLLNIVSKKSFSMNMSPSTIESVLKLLQVYWDKRNETSNIVKVKGMEMNDVTKIISNHLWVLRHLAKSYNITAGSKEYEEFLKVPIYKRLILNFERLIQDIVGYNLNLNETHISSIVNVINIYDLKESKALWQAQRGGDEEFGSWTQNIENNANIAKSMRSFDGPAKNLIDQINQNVPWPVIDNHAQYLMSNGVELPHHCFSLMIDMASKAKDIKGVERLYEYCERKYPHNNQRRHFWCQVYNHMIQAYASVKFTKGLEFKKKLEMMGARADANGYGALIHSAPTNDERYSPLNLMMEAKEKGIKANTYMYNTLLYRLSRSRHLKEAKIFYDEMERVGVYKSSITYGTMINLFCRTGASSLIKSTFDEMEADNQYIARVVPFNTVMQYYFETERNRDIGMEYYKRMISRGLKPTTFTYRLLMSAWAKIEPVNIQTADSLLNTMKEINILPDSGHYATLIIGRGVILKNLQSTKDFYNIIINKQGIIPDSEIYQAMIESFVACDSLNDGEIMLNEAIKSGKLLDSYLLNPLIRLNGKNGNIQRCWELFKLANDNNKSFSKTTMNASLYESMIRALCLCNQLNKCDEVLHEMSTSKKGGKVFYSNVIKRIENLSHELKLLRSEYGNELPLNIIDNIMSSELFRPGIKNINNS